MLVLFRFGRLVILKPDSKSNLYPSSYGVVSVNLVSDLLWVMFCELLLSCVLLFFLFFFFFWSKFVLFILFVFTSFEYFLQSMCSRF